MNQPRRTFLQTLLAMFGLGAAKAVSKTDATNWQNYSVPFEMTDEMRALEASDNPQFDTAIGVVNRGGFLHYADIIFGEGRRGTGMHGSVCFPYEWLNADEIAKNAEQSNAMIFADANEPDGQQLVDDLMKRCPERVWHGDRIQNNAGLTVTRPGVDKWHFLTMPIVDEWVTGATDRDQKTARSLAMYGVKVLTDARLLQDKDDELNLLVQQTMEIQNPKPKPNIIRFGRVTPRETVVVLE